MATKKKTTKKAATKKPTKKASAYTPTGRAVAPTGAAAVLRGIVDNIDKKQRTLPIQVRDQLEPYRSLGNYNTSYYNPSFPVLSFLYAIYAGGENTLYCDFTDEYVAKYLTGPNGRDVAAVFAELEPKRFDEPPPVPTAEQWSRVIAILAQELTQNPNMPAPFW